MRLAREEDVPALQELMALSARVLQAPYYSAAQIEAALGPVFDVDRQLILDGTYFVAEQDGQVIGCGGWSGRHSLYGGGSRRTTEDRLLDPLREPARLRAFFVHPSWARRGIGRALVHASENAIRAARFTMVELVATLAGEPLYAAHGYAVVERYPISLPDALPLPVVRMRKRLVHPQPDQGINPKTEDERAGEIVQGAEPGDV